MSRLCLQPLRGVFSEVKHDKKSRDNASFDIRNKAISQLKKAYPDTETSLFYEAYNQLSRNVVSEKATQESSRVDGRKIDELRPIGCQVDLHQPLHGSALFQRGQTQVMCTVSLDSLESALKSDAISMLMG